MSSIFCSTSRCQKVSHGSRNRQGRPLCQCCFYAYLQGQQIEKEKGPYSGLTREELRKTGTCETDWY
jgi:hypothetical protein